MVRRLHYNLAVNNVGEGRLIACRFVGAVTNGTSRTLSPTMVRPWPPL